MKLIKAIILIILLTSVALSQGFKIKKDVISSGGGQAESGVYKLIGTAGQPTVGKASSGIYCVESGFWGGVGCLPPPCYEYLPGDVNMHNGAWPPMVIGSDVTYLVNYFRGVASSKPCYMYNPCAGDSIECFWASADCNGDCKIIGSDVTWLVSYLRGIADSIRWCGWNQQVDSLKYYYLPCWPPLPPSAPSGWPNCVDPCPPEPPVESGINTIKISN